MWKEKEIRIIYAFVDVGWLLLLLLKLIWIS